MPLRSGDGQEPEEREDVKATHPRVTGRGNGSLILYSTGVGGRKFQGARGCAPAKATRPRVRGSGIETRILPLTGCGHRKQPRAQVTGGCEKKQRRKKLGEQTCTDAYQSRRMAAGVMVS